MSDTRALLSRISAFRERLEQVVPLGTTSHADCAKVFADPEYLSRSLRELTRTSASESPTPKLTAHARLILEQARELVAIQRTISCDPIVNRGGETDVLSKYHQTTVAMTETALRFLQSLPDSAELQLRLCAGAEAVFNSVRERLGVCEYAISERRRDSDRIERLSNLLAGLANGQTIAVDAFAELAEQIHRDARNGLPIRFLYADPNDRGVAGYVAAASLTTSQVVARVVGCDYEWASRPILPVVATLMMDVGLLRIKPEIVGKSCPLDADDRREIEKHTLIGAELIRRLIPDAGPLADVVAAHHERPDGSGYPDGLKGETIPSLARMLAVCSQYAAMATDRPHRPAYDTRAALTEILLAAEQGQLDRDFAEYLLNLSFYPVGTAVELTDGRVAIVIATHPNRINMNAAHRPVVAVLCDPRGVILSRPEYIDLTTASHGGIVRSISTVEKCRLLAERYPDLC